MAHRCLLFLPLSLALAGCAALPPASPPVTAGYCDPPLAYRYDPDFAPKTDLEAALTPELLAHYPRRNLLTANAVGILPALQTLLALQAAARRQPGPAQDLAVLRQRQRILAQVTLVGSTVSSLAAELDCEGERADQVAGYLAGLDASRTQRLNVLAIVIGALGGVGNVASTHRRTQLAFGVGGGLLAAGLGLLTLEQDGHTADFQHPRNLLADVWNENAASTTWPPSVWYLLTTPAFSNLGETSIAHNTRQRWLHYGQLADPGSAEGRQLAALLFGPGGTYTAAQLKVRADMLNELQSSVRLLNQELQGLLLIVNEE